LQALIAGIGCKCLWCLRVECTLEELQREKEETKRTLIRKVTDTDFVFPFFNQSTEVYFCYTSPQNTLMQLV